ncbi:MAG: hypothetical protein E7282_03775 [Lachnospiraceae bacterium]|nr:hypothetical protein [Lachnospiraceae bacterium]
MKKNPFKWLAVLLYLGAFLVSTIAYVYMGIDMDAESNKRILMAESIEKTVLGEISEAVTVSQMVCQDDCVRDLLQQEKSTNETELVRSIRDYLSRVQKKYNFATAYIISDATKNYYSYMGLNKTINPVSDSVDTWYTSFLLTGKAYQVDSSVDEANLNRMTIFVDGRIEDESGKAIGVAGVGVETSNMIEIIKGYETEYGVKVDFVDEDGLVQLGSDEASIRSSYVSGVELPEKSYDSYVYEPYGIGGFSVVRYVADVDWYLIVRSETGYGDVSYNYRFFFVQTVLMIIGAIVLLFAGRKIKPQTANQTQLAGDMDSETGLPTREYIFRIYGENGTLNTVQYQSIADFSIDDYEDVEKLVGSGRIVHSVVRVAREIFGQQGQIVRWNKSAFVVLIEPDVEEAEKLCREFCRRVEAIGDVTVSVGLTEIKLDDTLKKNYYRSVRNMYLVKELGGNNVKKQ